MTRNEFTIKTKCKGEIYNGGHKITNNSNYCVFYNGKFINEVRSKKDAERYIDNLIRHNKLTYTQEYK